MSQMRIFVSHNNTDNAFCRTLVKTLTDAGADVWFDEQNLGAAHLLEAITHELEDRPIFIVVLSKAAFASKFVRQECQMALALRDDEPHRVILPVVAQPIDRSDFTGIWLLLKDFRRVEAPGYKPYPQDEAIAQTLKLLMPDRQGNDCVVPPGLTAQELNDQGEALYYRGQYECSVRFCRRATELQPDNMSAWYNLAYSLMALGRNDEALPACERVLALRPKHSFAWNLKGYILAGMGLYKEQLVACERALELKPELGRNWANKADALANLRRYKEALDACEHGLAVARGSQFLQVAKANAFQGLARYDEALAIYDSLIVSRFKATAVGSWNGKAKALHLLGRYQDALAAYLGALAIEPKNSTAWAGAATTFRALNLRREALEADRHAKEREG